MVSQIVSRTVLLIAVFSAMGFGGFTLGRSHSQGGSDFGIPPEHPAVVALEAQKELKLTADQIAKLENIKASVSAMIEPYQKKMHDLQQRSQQDAQSGGNPQVQSQIQAEIKSLQADIEAHVRPAVEKTAQEVGQLLTEEQRQQLMQILQARTAKRGSDDLILTFIMEHRDDLGVSPAQFTKLMYLQADFIRAFAPLREQIEVIQMDNRQNQLKTGQGPSQEVMDKAHGIEKQVHDLKEQFSKRSVTEVLTSDQRDKLGHLMQERSGEHSGQ